MLPTTFQGNQKQTIDQAVESVFVRYLNSEVCRYFAVIASLRPLRRRQNWPSRHSWSPSTVSRSLCQFHFSPCRQYISGLQTGVRRTVAGRRRRRCPKAFVALMSRQLMICFGCLLAQALFTWFHVHLVYSGLTATAIFFPASLTLSSRVLLPCEFCWASLIEPVVQGTAYQPSRWLVSLHLPPCWNMLEQSVSSWKWLGFRWWCWL